MDEEYILRRLVGSYNPQDAIGLPFLEQRGIIEEITGYRVMDERVALLYLEFNDIELLVQDPAVAEVMREELAEDGWVLSNDEDLQAYIGRENSRNSILIREQANWPLLREQNAPAEFQELLLYSGSVAAREEYLDLIADREGSDELDIDEAKKMYDASLEVGDYDNLRWLDELDYGLGYTNDDVDDVLRLTERQVRNAIEYERLDHNDFTVFFSPAYYEAEAVPEFIYYMSQLNERQRMFAVAQLPGWGNINFSVENPIIQAYLEYFPDDYTAQEIEIGGTVALKQILEPNPRSEYSRSRGQRYQAEQRYSMLRDRLGYITQDEIDEARMEANEFRGREGLPPME